MISEIVRGGATKPAGNAVPGTALWRSFGRDCDRNIGASVGGIQRRDDAGDHRRAGLFATAFERASAAAHA